MEGVRREYTHMSYMSYMSYFSYIFLEFLAKEFSGLTDINTKDDENMALKITNPSLSY